MTSHLIRVSYVQTCDWGAGYTQFIDCIYKVVGSEEDAEAVAQLLYMGLDESIHSDAEIDVITPSAFDKRWLSGMSLELKSFLRWKEPTTLDPQPVRSARLVAGHIDAEYEMLPSGDTYKRHILEMWERGAVETEVQLSVERSTWS